MTGESNLNLPQPNGTSRRPQLDGEGQEEAERIAEQLGRDLAEEATRIAKRYQSSTIGADYVRIAAQRLLLPPSRWKQAANAVGAVLLGAGLSGYISMAAADNWTRDGLIASTVAFAIGCFSLGFMFRR